ncbi:hypothetical protein JGH11_18115 [Dysgonomonas sp. Marseille-P4677]|uniref:hypothetical protein n=1 Tax=Dysgonomonas sp. Marseille-P4677 TaxID=2364790 RepID=UPI0019121FF4|nr:hypothetical protein [Dysgonomonas sp. Marseille-P4677]MBK5722790.1 hypothetical protein [Dysgonomonas sp. Marseille-P4677]
MNIENKAPARGRVRTMKKAERMTQEETLKQLLENHKKDLGDVVQIKVNERTYIEVPASLTETERRERVKNYLKNISIANKR